MNGLVEHLLTHYAAVLGLLTLRCMAVFMLLPVFAGSAVPRRLRGGVALIIAFVLTPAAAPHVTETTLWGLAAAAAGELLIGLCMGLVARLTFLAAELAGGALGLQMGLAFSQVVDPLSKEQAPISARVLGLFATLLLVASGGHRIVLAALAASVTQVPIGAVFARFESPAQLVSLLALAASTGLRIAAPVMVALFLANVALALLSRAAPQLQLFILSFGLSIALGTLILASSSRYGLHLITEQVRQLPAQLAAVVGM